MYHACVCGPKACLHASSVHRADRQAFASICRHEVRHFCNAFIGAKDKGARVGRSCNNGSGKGLAAGMFIALALFLVVVFIWDIGGSGPGLMVKIKLLQNHLQVCTAPWPFNTVALLNKNRTVTDRNSTICAPVNNSTCQPWPKGSTKTLRTL